MTFSYEETREKAQENFALVNWSGTYWHAWYTRTHVDILHGLQINEEDSMKIKF